MSKQTTAREELLSAFLGVVDLYKSSPLCDPSKISYIEIELAEHLMHSINNVMFHYMEDIVEMRTKRKWGEEMIRAEKLLKKYSVDFKSSDLSLKKEFDDSGYLEQREFFGEVTTSRPRLKRKL
jgi:hypothetical protein